MWYLSLLLFILQIVIIFFTTRYVTSSLFTVFHRFTKNEFWSTWLLALVYLPGTFLHELSHFLTAIALILPVGELSLLPEIKPMGDGRYYVKLGHVTFGHKDYFRTMLVGIAPLIAGLAFFFFIFELDLFPTQNILLNVFGAYVLFSVSSSMFSSKKDMEGTIILIPILILVISLLIGFRVDVISILSSGRFQDIMWRFNTYLAYGSVSNVLLFVLTRRIINKRLNL